MFLQLWSLSQGTISKLIFKRIKQNIRAFHNMLSISFVLQPVFSFVYRSMCLCVSVLGLKTKVGFSLRVEDKVWETRLSSGWASALCGRLSGWMVCPDTVPVCPASRRACRPGALVCGVSPGLSRLFDRWLCCSQRWVLEMQLRGRLCFKIRLFICSTLGVFFKRSFFPLIVSFVTL